MHALTLKWPGGEHNFLLPLEGLKAVQTLCDAGPEWILERLKTRRWLVEDVTETIRLGLEYGGMKPDEARRILALALNSAAPLALVVTAKTILGAAISLGKDDTPGEFEAGAGSETPDPLSSEENGASQSSINGPQPSTLTSES